MRASPQMIATPLWVLLPLLLLSFSTAGASERFPDNYPHPTGNYIKVGEDRYNYKRIFKVYDAALYRAPNTPPAAANQVLNGNYGFKLQFNYLRTIDKQIAIDSAETALSRNLETEQQNRIAARVAELNRAYRSVVKGDSSVLHYEPGVGTHYIFNGQRLATIPGDDFAQLYFRVWLGEQPLSKPLRDALLGKN